MPRRRTTTPPTIETISRLAADALARLPRTDTPAYQRRCRDAIAHWKYLREAMDERVRGLQEGEVDVDAMELIEKMHLAWFGATEAKALLQRHVVRAVVLARQALRAKVQTLDELVPAVRRAGDGLPGVKDAIIATAITKAGHPPIAALLRAAGKPITESMIDKYSRPSDT